MELSKVGRLLPAAARPLVRRPLVRYRFLGLRAADGVLDSYPKSGSTWLRFLLANVLTAEETDFDGIRDTMPRVGRHRGAPVVLPHGGRFLRTHEPLRPYYGHPGQPVIYLVRDGRDVCVSYFNHVRRQGFDGDLASFVGRFLDGKVDGYGTWREHVLTGLAFGRTTSTPFLLMRYEDFRDDPVEHLGRTLAFLGVDAEPEAVQAAVAANQRDRMLAKEASSEFLQTRRRDAGTAERRSWAEAVPAALRDRFETECADALVAAGYDRAGGAGRG